MDFWYLKGTKAFVTTRKMLLVKVYTLPTSVSPPAWVLAVAVIYWISSGFIPADSPRPAALSQLPHAASETLPAATERRFTSPAPALSRQWSDWQQMNVSALVTSLLGTALGTEHPSETNILDRGKGEKICYWWVIGRLWCFCSCSMFVKVGLPWRDRYSLITLLLKLLWLVFIKKVVMFETQRKSEKMSFLLEKYCGNVSYFLKGIFKIKI